MKASVFGWFLLAVILSGCRIERHFISPPGVSQTLRAESGDRFFFDLDEETDAGCRWLAVCHDSDVEVKIEHSPAKAAVEIRFHRGYDGPTNVQFFYHRPHEEMPARQFTLAFFKRTGDSAFWE